MMGNPLLGPLFGGRASARWGSDNQLRLPRQYLLFYTRTPNNWLDVGWETDFGWDSDLSAWSIPRTVMDWTGAERDMFTILGEGIWFDAAGNSLVVIGAQILAWAGINQYHILFSLTKGLAVYDPYAVTDAVIVKADKYMHQPLYSDTPEVFFNGCDITGSTSFDSGVLGTNPGQWVLDNTGTLVNAGVDAPAVEGARLEWVPSGVDLSPGGGTFDSAVGWILGGGWEVDTNAKIAKKTTATGSSILTSATSNIFAGKMYRCTFKINSRAGGGVIGIPGSMIPSGWYPAGVGIFTRDFLSFNQATAGLYSTEVCEISSLSIQELLPVWRDTALDGTPLMTSTQQPTRTSNTVLDGSDTGPELVVNSSFAGAVAGTPGTAPTSWTLANAGGSLSVSGSNLTFSTTAQRQVISQSSAVAANSTYKAVFNINLISGVNVFGQFAYVASTPAGATLTYSLNGVVINPSLIKAPLGESTIEVLIKIAGTAGTAQLRVGAGALANGTSSCTIYGNVSFKQVLPAFTSNFTPATTFKRYDPSNPLVMPGFLSEPARTNKCTCRKANPVDTTNLTKSGDAASVLSVVDDTAALTAAGLIGVCNTGKVYKLNNSAGSIESWVTILGATGNTNAHSLSVYARGSGTRNNFLALDGQIGSAVTLTAGYLLYKQENVVPGNASKYLSIGVAPYGVVYFILPKLEEGAFCTSPICKLQDGTDPLTTITRAGTVLSYPTLGKIRPNNQAYRMTVVPRASGQVGYIYSSYFDSNNFYRIAIEPTKVTFQKRKLTTYEASLVNYSHMSGTPIDVIVIQSSTGTCIGVRPQGGVWINSALNKTTTALEDLMVGSTYQLGSLNGSSQFTGNISELETLDIPLGITDPLAWAKAQWGLPA